VELKKPTTEAFEAHLRALTKTLDNQVTLVRSALELHPAATVEDVRRAAEEALGKFNAAVGDLRSLTAVATTAVASAFELSERSSSAPAIGDEGMPDSAYLSSPTMAASIGGALAYKRNDDSVRSGEEAAWRVLDEAQLEGPGPQSNGGDSANSAVSLSPTPPLQPGVDDAFDGEGEDSFPVADWDHSPGQVKKWRVDQSHIHSAQVRAASLTGPSKTRMCFNGVLNPDWPLRLAWDLVVVCLVMCDSVVIPLQLAELRLAPQGFDDVWLWFTVSVFGCDVVTNFFTAYHAGKNDMPIQEGALVTDRVSIAINYFRGWFWIDFLSTVPWPTIADSIQSDQGSSSASQVTKLAKIVKLTRLLRLMRMLRLCKLSVIWERVECRIGSIAALNVVSMLKVLGVWTAICHWGACVWWMIGKRDSLAMLVLFQDDDPDTLHWTELPRRHSPYDDVGQWRWVDREASEQYVFCFYWILGVMRTMPAEVTPVTLIERLFVLLFMFFAVMAFAVNVARITQAWFKFSARKDAFKEEMAYVRMHLRSIDCGASLQMRTQGYLNHLYEKRKIHAKEAGLLGALPEPLKLQLNQAHRIRFLRMIPRLQEWKDPDLRRVCDATDAIDYLPGDKVTEKNCDAEAAHVLMRGNLQFFVPEDMRGIGSTGSRSTRQSTRRSFVQRLSGVSRGIDPLKVVDDYCLFDMEADVKSRNTVVALECSEVLRIDRRMFQEALVLLSTPAAQGQERHQRPAGNRTISFGSAGSRASPVRMTPTTDTYHTAHTRFSIDSEVESFVEDPDEEDGGLRHGRPAGVQQALEVNAARTSAGWQHIAAAQTMA